MYASGGYQVTPILQGPDVDPVGYVKAVYNDFLNLFPQIQDQLHRAATMSATLPSGSLGQQTARKAVDALAYLAKVHTATIRKIEEYGGYVGLLSGAVPVAVVTVFAALALIVAWSFREYEAQKQILDMIQAGTLTPEQAVQVAESTGPVPSVDVLGGVGAAIGTTGLILLAVLAFVLWQRGQGFRPNPDLLVFHENPPAVWSHRVYDIRYRHDEDGADYVHDFRPGVQVEALEDGSVRLFHPHRRLWEEF